MYVSDIYFVMFRMYFMVVLIICMLDDKGKLVLEVFNMYYMLKNIFLKYKVIDGMM